MAINSITIYMWTWTNKDHRDLKSFASGILVLLAYLPLFVIPMQFVSCTRQRNWKKFWKHIPLLDSVRIFKRRQNDDAALLNLSEERRAMELYKGAKTVEILAIKYVTIFYSLLLVVTAVLV